MTGNWEFIDVFTSMRLIARPVVYEVLSAGSNLKIDDVGKRKRKPYFCRALPHAIGDPLKKTTAR